MEKAKIFEVGKENEGFTVQFNPNSLEYSIYSNKKNKKGLISIASVSSNGGDTLQSDPTGLTGKSVLSVRLFFHTYENDSTYTDVRQKIKNIQQYVRYSGNTAAGNDPKITFAWGPISHTGVLDGFSTTYQMFAPDGVPVQAEVSISIVGDEGERAVEAANKLTGLKAALKELSEEIERDPLLTMWDWLYL